MPARSNPASADPAADPFDEQSPSPWRLRLPLLGAWFEFESNDRRLLRLVESAYAALPRQPVARAARPFRIQLKLAPRATRRTTEPPLLRTHCGPGELLCGLMDADNFVLLSPRARTGLVAVSSDMLAHPYHVRYELIEFAVFTLASRGQGLLSMHAGCVGQAGRGLLLVGDSGTGKSTLALHAALIGMALLAEDAVFVHADRLEATGISNYLHIRPDALRFLAPATAARLARAPTIQRRSGVAKLEIDLRRLQRSLPVPPLRIEGVVFLSARKARIGSALIPLRRRDWVARLAAAQSYAAQQPAWAVFRKRLAQIPGFELRRAAHPAVSAASLQQILA